MPYLNYFPHFPSPFSDQCPENRNVFQISIGIINQERVKNYSRQLFKLSTLLCRARQSVSLDQKDTGQQCSIFWLDLILLGVSTGELSNSLLNHCILPCLLDSMNLPPEEMWYPIKSVFNTLRVFTTIGQTCFLGLYTRDTLDGRNRGESPVFPKFFKHFNCSQAFLPIVFNQSYQISGFILFFVVFYWK